MFNVLEAYIKSKKEIPQGELEEVRKIHRPRTVKKGAFLLQPGQVCTESMFIASGCLRVYRLDNEGNEHILRFGIENWWITDNESYNTGSPSRSYIEALEDCTLIAFDKTEYERLLQQAPELRSLTEYLLSRTFHAFQERVYCQISLGAEDRYRNFIKTYPDIFRRVPLHMIASYLGLSRKTLTRIRQQENRSGG